MEAGSQHLYDVAKQIGIDAECLCHRCCEENNIKGPDGFPFPSCAMILCKKCGNKRCPQASDHRLECTRSNEPGQDGSVFK